MNFRNSTPKNQATTSITKLEPPYEHTIPEAEQRRSLRQKLRGQKYYHEYA